MKVCILGSTGIIGNELLLQLSTLPQVTVTGLSSSNIDLYCNLDKLDKCLAELRPDILINASGFTDIDGIEQKKQQGFFLNALVPHCLAEICSRMSMQLVHFSTDNVFDGSQNIPYVEDRLLSPINYYGWTKAHADKILLNNFADSTTIFRISAIYSHMKKNFFTSFLKRLIIQDIVEVVDDIKVAPTPARLVSNCIMELAKSDELFKMRGVYHLTTKGETSWFGFARIIAESLNLSNKIVLPVSSDLHCSNVKRPKMCLLDSGKLERQTSINLIDWQDSFQDFLSTDSAQAFVKTYF